MAELGYPNPYRVEYDGVEYRIHWEAMAGGGHRADIRRPGHSPWYASNANLDLGEFLDYVANVRIPHNIDRSKRKTALLTEKDGEPVADSFPAFAQREFYQIALTNAWCPDHNSTADQYRSKMKNKLAPQFPNDLSIRDITWDHCEEALDRLEQSYMSNKPGGNFVQERKRLAWILNSIFAYARSLGVIDRNPMEELFQSPVSRLPYLAATARRNRLERKCLSVQEVQFFWEVIRSKHLEIGQLVGIALMLFTGVRTAEACALKYGDMVELAPGEYSIRVVAQTRQGKRQISNILKTPAGYRMIPLIQPLAELLLHRRERLESMPGISNVPSLPLSCLHDEPRERCSPADLNTCTQIIMAGGEETARLRTSMSDALAAIEEEDGPGQMDKEDREPTAYTLRKTALMLFNTAGGLTHTEAAYLMGHSLKHYVSGARWNVARDYAAPEKQREMLERLNQIGLWLRPTPDVPENATSKHGKRHYIVSPGSIELNLTRETRLMVRAADPNKPLSIRIRSLEQEDMVVLLEPRREKELDERDEISDCHLLRRDGSPFGSELPEDVIEQDARDEEEQPAKSPAPEPDSGSAGQKADSGKTADAGQREDTTSVEPPPPGEATVPARQKAASRKTDAKTRRMGKALRNTMAALAAGANRITDMEEPDNSLLLPQDDVQRSADPLKGEWLILLTRKGRIKRIHMRGGDLIRFYQTPALGIRCIGLNEEDEVLCLDFAGERDRLLLATSDGNIHALRVEDIPASKSREAKGEWLNKLLALPQKKEADVVSFTAMMTLPASIIQQSVQGEFDEYTVAITMDNGRVFRHKVEAFHSLLKGRPGGRPFADTDGGSAAIVGMSLAIKNEHLMLSDTDGYINLIATDVDKPKGKYTRMVQGNISKKMRSDGKCIGAAPHSDGKAVAVISTDGRILRMRFKSGQHKAAEAPGAKFRLGLISMTGLKTGSDSSLVTVCDAEKDSALIVATSDGLLSCVKSGRFAVRKNKAKGSMLLKLREGERVVAVRAVEGINCDNR